MQTNASPSHSLAHHVGDISVNKDLARLCTDHALCCHTTVSTSNPQVPDPVSKRELHTTLIALAQSKKVGLHHLLVRTAQKLTTMSVSAASTANPKSLFMRTIACKLLACPPEKCTLKAIYKSGAKSTLRNDLLFRVLRSVRKTTQSEALLTRVPDCGCRKS